MSWQIILSRQAIKDAKKIARADYKQQAEKLLQILAVDRTYTENVDAL